MDKDERFLEVLGGLNIGPYDLEKEGVKNAQAKVSHYRNGVTKGISSDIIISLCTLYPQVNANYILTGRGDMFLSDSLQEMYDEEANEALVRLREEYKELKKENEELKKQIKKMESA